LLRAFLGELDQFLDHLGRLDGAVLVLAHGLLEQLRERFGWTTLRFASRADLALEELLQQLDGEVPVRACRAPRRGTHRRGSRCRASSGPPRRRCRRPFGDDRLRDDLADGVVQLSSVLRSPVVFFASTARTAWKKPTSSRMRSASSCGTASANACESSVTASTARLAVLLRQDVLLGGRQQGQRSERCR
jgi:hypothetical protein